jgi:hypothetical protein
MQRDDFENHKLWSVLDAIDRQIDDILGQGQLEAVAPLESVRFYMAHVRSFKALGATSVALFTDDMLSAVGGVFADVSYSLDLYTSRHATSYLEQAASRAEGALIEMAPWPRPYSRGRQVQQITSLYEDLLDVQRNSVKSLETVHERLRGEIAGFRKEAHDERSLNGQELEYFKREAQDAVKAINAEKRRIDEVVKNGLQQTADLRNDNERSLRTLSQEMENSFEERFEPLETGIRQRLDEAVKMLTYLKETETAYNNISSQAASDKLAEHFEQEAKTGRTTGIVAYAVGFVFLALSAIPLLLLLQPVSAESTIAPAWSVIATRLSIGVIGASAATVVIRLGATFIASAARSKRMELELRTFGPFLANVEDQSTVDQARLDLIEKSFGQSVAERSESKEDVVPVSALGHITDLLSKVLAR